MNVYVWQEVTGLTDSYHSGGGLVVVAESLEAARALVNGSAGRLEAFGRECVAVLNAALAAEGKSGEDLFDPEERSDRLDAAALLGVKHLPVPAPGAEPLACCTGCVDGLPPTATYPTADGLAPALYVFPDEGCC
jgi:hypothetical protein